MPLQDARSRNDRIKLALLKVRLWVTLTSATGGTIYYTTDGSDPTESSTEYKEAVLLQSEGDTEIRAIAVNKKGIPSAVSSAKYSIEFPLVDAPAVSPSTGQYSTATQITITGLFYGGI